MTNWSELFTCSGIATYCCGNGDGPGAGRWLGGCPGGYIKEAHLQLILLPVKSTLMSKRMLKCSAKYHNFEGDTSPSPHLMSMLIVVFFWSAGTTQFLMLSDPLISDTTSKIRFSNFLCPRRRFAVFFCKQKNTSFKVMWRSHRDNNKTHWPGRTAYQFQSCRTYMFLTFVFSS